MLVHYSAMKSSNVLKAKLVWTCPADMISQFYSDQSGDIVIAVNDPVEVCKADRWDSQRAAVLDAADGLNYLQLQLVLEKCIGSQLARYHPLVPPPSKHMSTAYKCFSSGMKKYFMQPKKARYHLYGCVLYEFSPLKSEANNASMDALGEEFPLESGAGAADADKTAGGDKAGDDSNGKSSAGGAKFQRDEKDEVYVSILNRLFGCEANDAKQDAPADLSELEHNFGLATARGSIGGTGWAAKTASALRDNVHAGEFLSYAYPLVEIKVTGPDVERLNMKTAYSITFSRKDGKSLRCLKRDSEGEIINEHHKSSVVLIFETEELANSWKEAIETASIRASKDTWNGETAYIDKKVTGNSGKSTLTSVNDLIQSSAASVRDMQNRLGEGQGNFFKFDWNVHSIVGKLIIPTSGLSPTEVEKLKVEVGTVFSSCRQ
jgi:hypothetical protein